ncbi:MAG: DUF309 domain-containing protein [Campylobacterota bacterium]|nr:DUF309 domain-containing protein [Campylobacterota bacterium]
MLKENNDLEGALREYLLLLGKQEYFDAHEVLEEAWHPLRRADHPLKNLTKGLINGAISFEHLKRDRKNAHIKAQRVIASYERHKYLCTSEVDHADLFGKACIEIEGLKQKYKEVFDVLVS